jgi:hypothetical protein
MLNSASKISALRSNFLMTKSARALGSYTNYEKLELRLKFN